MFRGGSYEFFEGGGGSGQKFFEGRGGGGFRAEILRGGLRVIEKASPWEFSYRQARQNLEGFSGVFSFFLVARTPPPPPHGNNITWKFDVGLH